MAVKVQQVFNKKNKMKVRNLLLLLAFCCLSLAVQAQFVSTSAHPKREFRAAWIQAVNGQFRGIPTDRLKQILINQLNSLQGAGINAVIFQVRPEADALYASQYEPWSRFLTGVQGKAPEPYWDPMQFMIEECHKRSMEFHAWINPYRVKTSLKNELSPIHIYNSHPEWFVTYGDQLYFDPALPESRNHICKVITDIVSRYDVDAIHMDDYFYPYPAAGMPFPDDNSFRKYGLRKGYSEAQRNDWRRENVNTDPGIETYHPAHQHLGYASVSVPSASTATRKAPQTDRVAIPTVCKTTTTSTPISPIGYSKVGSIITSPRSIGRSDTRQQITSRLSNGGTKTPTEVIYISGKTWPAP